MTRQSIQGYVPQCEPQPGGSVNTIGRPTLNLVITDEILVFRRLVFQQLAR